jgi:hypothetical protein
MGNAVIAIKAPANNLCRAALFSDRRVRRGSVRLRREDFFTQALRLLDVESRVRRAILETHKTALSLSANQERDGAGTFERDPPTIGQAKLWHCRGGI